EMAEVSEPIEKERVVIERRAVQTGTAVDGDHSFSDQEVARMEVYEEDVDVQKQAYVTEEVSVRKVTDRETVRAREEVRREELDVDKKGNPNIRV
ncbi:MAG: DUF2382 domain-containing protein, partial [Cyanobacteria bacterium J06638_6]